MEINFVRNARERARAKKRDGKHWATCNYRTMRHILMCDFASQIAFHFNSSCCSSIRPRVAHLIFGHSVIHSNFVLLKNCFFCIVIASLVPLKLLYLHSHKHKQTLSANRWCEIQHPCKLVFERMNRILCQNGF